MYDPLLNGGGLVRSLGGWSNVLAVRRKGEREEADQRVLGSGKFVQSVLKEAELRQRRQLKLRISGGLRAWPCCRRDSPPPGGQYIQYHPRHCEDGTKGALS